MFTLTHSRLSFGQALRAAKRTGSLRQYRRTSCERLAVVSGGTVLRYGNGYADHLPMEWVKPWEQDGSDTSESWAGGFAENH
jgi:hypothetical protein